MAKDKDKAKEMRDEVANRLELIKRDSPLDN